MDRIAYTPRPEYDRELHPVGAFAARCVDVIDLGMRVRDFNGKKSAAHTIAIVFSTGKVSKEGFTLDLSQEFSFTLGDRGNLKKMLETWRGREYTEEEKGASFDIAKEVGGKPALLSVVHRKSADGKKTYANIGAVMAMPEGMMMPALPGYQRAPYWKDRKEEYARKFEEYMRAAAHDTGEAEETYDPTPF